MGKKKKRGVKKKKRGKKKKTLNTLNLSIFCSVLMIFVSSLSLLPKIFLMISDSGSLEIMKKDSLAAVLL